jgi:hypothetical protein
VRVSQVLGIIFMALSMWVTQPFVSFLAIMSLAKAISLTTAAFFVASVILVASASSLVSSA